MQASAWTCNRSAADSMSQNVGKSSQYTSIIPHRVIQLTIILGPRDKAVPPTSQQISQFPPNQVKYWHSHPFLFLFLILRRPFFALNQSEARFAEPGKYSQNMLSEAF